MSHGNNTYPTYNYMVNYRQYPPKYNKEEYSSLGIVSDTMMKSPTNLSRGSQRMDLQTREGKKWLMLTTCCKIQGWETQVNCRQPWWTEGAGRAVCSMRGVLKDDQNEMRLITDSRIGQLWKDAKISAAFHGYVILNLFFVWRQFVYAYGVISGWGFVRVRFCPGGFCHVGLSGFLFPGGVVFSCL